MGLKAKATPLERDRLSRTYLLRLSRGWQSVLRFLALGGLSWACWHSSPSLAEEQLAEYVQHCFNTQIPFWLAKHGVLAAQLKVRSLRGKIRRAWDALSSWRLTMPTGHRVPFPIEILNAVSLVALELALGATSQSLRWLSLHVLLRVGFHALLRPAELCNLRAGDLKFSLGRVPYVVLAVRNPKNRAFLGRMQFVILKDQATVLLLHWFVKGLAPEVKLWSGSVTTMRTTLKELLSLMGLSGLGLSLGSLRSGGTTYLYLSGSEIARLKYTGRWKSEASLGCYIQEAMALLVWLHLSEAQQLKVFTLCRAGLQALRFPPPVPWTAIAARRPWRTRSRLCSWTSLKLMQPR